MPKSLAKASLATELRAGDQQERESANDGFQHDEAKAGSYRLVRLPVAPVFASRPRWIRSWHLRSRDRA